MSDAVQEVKQNLEIIDVISQYVELKKTGKNFRGICPFHKESTPSFFVTPDRQAWHCFGCKKGGDIFNFVMEKEGLDFRSALELLAEKAGVTLEQYHDSDNEPRQQIYRALETAAEYYETILSSSLGDKALQYLHTTRSVPDNLIKTFHIGYAPDSWDKTGSYLMQQGFSEEILLKAGLIIAKDQGNRGWYDRFRDRVMFPIYDRVGHIVGFSGRVLDSAQKTAKYVNTPETPVFKKSDLLFGYQQAKDAILMQDYTIIVEGQLDVIAMHKLGIRNVVAPLGTALTDQHLQQLKRMSNRVMLLFDNDQAGQAATLKSLESCLRQEMNIKVAVLKHGDDPDDAATNYPTETKEDLKKSQHYFNYLVDTAETKFADSPNKAADTAEFILPFLEAIPNPIQQESYIQQLSNTTGISISSLSKTISKSNDSSRNETTPSPINKDPSIPKPSSKQKATRATSLWFALATMLIQLPEHLYADAQLLDILKDLDTTPNETDTSHIKIARTLVTQLLETHTIDHDKLNETLSEEEQTTVDRMSMRDLGMILETEDSYLISLEQVVRDINVYAVKSAIQTLKEQNLEPAQRLQRLKELTAALQKYQSIEK